MKRVCLLTGASGLLGRAFIARHAEQFEIIAVHRHNDLWVASQELNFVDPLDPERLLVENLRQVFSVRADLSSPEEIDRLTTAALDRFGQVDMLINAAAYRRWSGLLDDWALDDAEWHFAVNVVAPLRLAVSLADKFWRTRGDENVAANRHVLNISSTAGSFVYPDLGQTLYSASKAALDYATYHMAAEFWNIGIRVNGVAPNTFPGIVPTERVLDEMLALDKSTDTGRVVIVDQ